ncbi:immunoglobulin-like domain-containing protein, partial [Syntrophomonas palmitatica]|uniref:immunoglobulin-like domain-containing protein n=1 Tax=Syntrophomonas palmitatica TaxID=402877 RepID=UPI001A9A531D
GIWHITEGTSYPVLQWQWTLNSPTDEEKVTADKAALEIGFAAGDSASSVTQNLTLATTGSVYNSAITWVSSNTAVISNSGEVTRPSFSCGDAVVTLTATISSNGVSEPKAFTLTVLKQPQQPCRASPSQNRQINWCIPWANPWTLQAWK